MKKIIVVLAVTLFYFNAVAQKENKIEFVKSRIDTLGISAMEKSDKSKSSYGTIAAYWNTSYIILQFAQKSATADEMFEFLKSGNNIGICQSLYGGSFLLLAVEEKGITYVIIKNAKINSVEFVPANKVNNFFMNDAHYFKKSTTQK